MGRKGAKPSTAARDKPRRELFKADDITMEWKEARRAVSASPAQSACTAADVAARRAGSAGNVSKGTLLASSHASLPPTTSLHRDPGCATWATPAS